MRPEMIVNQKDAPLQNGEEVAFYIFTRNKWWNYNQNQQESFTQTQLIKGHKSRNWGNKWGRWNQRQNFHKLSPLAKGNQDNKWGCYTQRQNFTDIKV